MSDDKDKTAGLGWATRVDRDTHEMGFRGRRVKLDGSMLDNGRLDR